MVPFVDIHSHVVPSGDDGVSTAVEAIELCRRAHAAGTRILYATPHVWPHEGLAQRREAAIGENFASVSTSAADLGLELRLGYELTPATALLDQDPSRFVLGGTSAVLLELPFSGPLQLAVMLAEHIEAAGLQPIIGHPERCEFIVEDPRRLSAMVERGWLIQVNARSLLGAYEADAHRLAVDLINAGNVAFIASDGHSAETPPVLDQAYVAATRLVGAEAVALFDGRNLPGSVTSHSAGQGAARP